MRGEYLVELEHVGAGPDAVALVDDDVAGHPAQRGPAGAGERQVPARLLLVELHQPPRRRLGEPQPEVGREVEAGAQGAHHLLPDLHRPATSPPPKSGATDDEEAANQSTSACLS
jgi:hypothetical protein